MVVLEDGRAAHCRVSSNLARIRSPITTSLLEGSCEWLHSFTLTHDYHTKLVDTLPAPDEAPSRLAAVSGLVMNSLDPSLAKYLSKSKQDIYEQYHGSGSAVKKKKKSKRYDAGDSIASTSSAVGSGLIIADDADDVVDPWSRRSTGMLVDGDDDDAGQPSEHILAINYVSYS